MDMPQNSRNSKNFLLTMVLLSVILYVVVFFDVPIARQAIGFLYLTFLPGFALWRLLKFEKTSLSLMVLFSVGFSLAILMIGGLLTNEFCSAIGISKPLSDTPLILMFSGITLLFSFLSSFASKDSQVQVVASLKLIAHSPLALLFLVLPLLSILGTMWVNVYESNLILLIMIVIVALLFTIGALFKKLLPPELYPFAVLTIAISLLFHSSLISSYVQSQRSDIALEYFVFKVTEENARWNFIYYGDALYGRFNSMLSITILPTIYSNLLNIDATWILKILYPLLFAFVPLGLFQFWLPRVGKKGAFVSIFLFMAQETFYTEAVSLARQMIAELFFVLLLIIVLDKKMKTPNKWISFAILSIALVISHYSLSIVFLFFIFLVSAILFVTKRTIQKITVPMIIFFLVVMFSWYIYTSNSSAFNSILSFGNNVLAQLNQFFDPSARGSTVLRGLGMEAAPSIWNGVSRAIAYLTQFLIVVGFIGLLGRKIEADVDQEFFMFSLVAMALLAMLILIPGLANTLSMTRFYHVLLFFLAPLCFFGAESLVKFVFRRKTELKVSILLLTLVIPYFLFQISFVYEVTGSESWLSVPLSKQRMGELRLYGYYLYIDEQNVFGAQWLHKNIEVKYTQLYADMISHYAVLSYGMTYSGYVEMFSNVTPVTANGVIYLNRLNINDGTIIGERQSWNYSELSILEDTNKIYSNGRSEIYKATGN